MLGTSHFFKFVLLCLIVFYNVFVIQAVHGITRRMVGYHDSVVAKIQADNSETESTLSLASYHVSTLEHQLVVLKQENIDLIRQLEHLNQGCYFAN